ncbi:D-alanyl-D-alanine carboxypeptidase [Streptomyces sp. NPDC001056]
MAGESPDRSKQRESSAEATSGSADSVPEARDPRLAVARDSGGSASAGQKDSSNGGGDTATKVLRTPAVEEDTALRHAVSAWVRDADEPTDAAETPAEGSETPAKGSEKHAEGSEAGPASAGTDGGAAEDDADAKDGGAAKDDADAEGAVEAEATSGTDAGGKTGSAAVADEEAEPEAAAAAAAAAADDAAVASGSAAESAADAKAPAGDDANAPEAEAGSGPRKRPAPTDGTAEETATAATTEAAEAETPAGDAGAKGGIDAEAADGEAEAEGAANDEANDDAPDADGGKDPQGPPAGGDEGRTGGAGGKTAEDEAEAATDKAANADGDGEAKAAADGVDQPTTVFKAVRPKAPDVDQPTTMLKVGPAAGKREASDPERTSKFVALKDDMRQKPKPKAAPADETAAVPRLGPERTTQQPLPPKPPLDLLAELTNTPPPPETPVRTFLRRVKIWTPLVILLVIVFAVVQTLRPLPSPALALTAKDTYTFGGGRVNLPWPDEGQGWMDGDGIGTMGNFGKQTPVAIGSVAKTMTAYIILRDHPLKPGQEGPKIKVDATAEKEGGYSKSGESTLDTVHAGDSLTEKQALSAVMIPSANNIARLLARWDAGSEAAFVKKMNATAKQLGMTGTTYTDPSGLKETTVSTAQDQVKLGRAVVKVPALVAITSAASWTDPTGHNWPNYNSLPYWIGAIGIKTGTTTAAGGNLLFAARKKVGGQTVTVVGAILGQHKGPSILDTANNVSKTALLGAEQALTSAKILKKGDVVGYVDDQLGGHTPIVVTRDVTAVGWSGLKVELSFTSGTVPHTAKAGTEVGTLTVGDGTTAGVKVPVALQRDLAEPGFGAKLTRLG